jgi:hypothetical protein
VIAHGLGVASGDVPLGSEVFAHRVRNIPLDDLVDYVDDRVVDLPRVTRIGNVMTPSSPAVM